MNCDVMLSTLTALCFRARNSNRMQLFRKSCNRLLSVHWCNVHEMGLPAFAGTKVALLTLGFFKAYGAKDLPDILISGLEPSARQMLMPSCLVWSQTTGGRELDRNSQFSWQAVWDWNAVGAHEISEICFGMFRLYSHVGPNGSEVY